MPDFERFAAFRWSDGNLESIDEIEKVEDSDLLYLEEQKNLLAANFNLFLENKPFLNVLLWGERGSGKSSLVKLFTDKYFKKGLRVIEFTDDSLRDVFKLYKILRKENNLKFILYFDDISFDRDDKNYRQFKSILEGGLEKTPSNVMYIMTTNKRHIISDHSYDINDIYSRDETNERISLYSRFGLVVGFYPISKEIYLNVAEHYLKKYSVILNKDWKKEAENFAIEKGGRSCRIAKQFAVSKLLLNKIQNEFKQ